MPIEFTCPECEEPFERKAPAPGKAVRCPECEHVFRPKGGTKAAKKAAGGGLPPWAMYAMSIGGAVVVAGIIILVISSGGKPPEPVAQGNPPPVVLPPPIPVTPQPPQPEPRPQPQPRPQPKSQPRPEPELPPPLIGAPDKPTNTGTNPPKLPPSRPAELPPRVDLPPLPPPDQRPTLLLDPGNHTAFIKAVQFTPDGKKFVTVSEDKTIRVWDSGSGACAKTIPMPNGPGPEGRLYALAVSPSGKSVAVGGYTYGADKRNGDMFSYLVSLETGQVVRTFGGHADAITTLSFSQDGVYLASGSMDHSVRVYKVATGELTGNLIGHADVVTRIRFQPKGRKLATASKDGTARVWTPVGAGNTSVGLISGPNPDRINEILWSPDGKQVFTGGGDGVVRVWSDLGKPVHAYDRFEAKKPGGGADPMPITSMAVTRDNKELVVGMAGLENQASVLTLAGGARRSCGSGVKHSNVVFTCCASPVGDLAITVGGDANEMMVWKTKDGSLVHDIRTASKAVWTVASAEGGVLAFGSTAQGGTVDPQRVPLATAFDLTKLDFVPLPKKPTVALSGFGAVDVRPTADRKGVQVLRNGQPAFDLALPLAAVDRVSSVTLTESGLLFVGSTRQLNLFDLKTRKHVRTFAGVGGVTTHVAPTPEGLFVSGCTDHVIRLWHPDREDPVVSFFAADREWIAWTPEGYYAASPGGERLMGWLMNNGDKKVGTYFPAVQFRQTLYQPDVIKNLIKAGGDLGLAMAIAVRDTKRPVPAVNLSQVLPPSVAITSPKVADGGEYASAGETVQVSATATGDAKHPVKSLRLLVDGRPYKGDEGVKTIAAPKAGEVTATFAVTLSPGKHTLVVQADNGASKGMSPAVEVAQAGEEKLPNLYVFAVGVDSYPGKMKLNFAASDARAMADVFRTRTNAVFGKAEVKLITDKQASKTAILEGLDWMKSVMTARDVGVFYFSGHGACDPFGTFYLVPQDVDELRPGQTCLPGDLVRKKLTDMPGKLVAIFDACHSGAAADSLQVGRTDGLVRDLLSDDCGVVVLCSSLGSESSLEASVTKGGVFTFGLLEGLRGNADLNGDGFVYIDEVVVYAAIRVKQLTGGIQNPTLGRSPHLRPFPLTRGK